MNFFSRSAAFAIIFAGSALDVMGSSLPEFAPPKVQVVDEYGVNLLNGQVASSLETVSIGGALGLSHSISNFTNNFLISGYRGYQDKFLKSAVVTVLDDRPFTYKNVLRVSDFSDAADFRLVVNGVEKDFSSASVPNYTYRALGDTRHILESGSGVVYWTKPDGTVVTFNLDDAARPDQVGAPKEIKYPNGFTIYTDYNAKRVTTNTGFALKYIYKYDVADANIDPAKLWIRYDHDLPTVSPQMWAEANPKYIQAINTSVESCLKSDSTCTKTWPTAEFKWPAGMPRAIFLGDSTFRVTDAAGGTTEFYFRSFDLSKNEYDKVVDGHKEFARFSPRLVGIKPVGSTERVFSYVYKNLFDTRASDHSTWFVLSSEAGQVKSAQRYDKKSGYIIGSGGVVSAFENLGGGYVERVQPRIDLYPGAVNKVETRDSWVNYEQSFRNFPTRRTLLGATQELYGYDARGNMDSYTKGGVTMTALYPSRCNEINRKYCNKPIWTRDAKLNQTDYIYHAESGQLEKVTYPPNKNNLRAETRYVYEQKYANYHSISGVKAQATSPIWLKTAEKYCINSNATDGVCAGSDEVVTRYEYEHDNLFLTGMTVTDPQGKTLRTCYEYDDYGNRIGETQPRAKLTSCN
jgi:YD repeat-containing protein